MWFSEAQNDFNVGKILSKKKKYNAAVFHFVQAAEKAVKSILYYLKQHPWGHSIRKLLDAYEKVGQPVPIEIKIAGNELDPHYINSRYPDSIPEQSPQDYYTKKLARELQKNAEKILEFVKNEREMVDANGDS